MSVANFVRVRHRIEQFRPPFVKCACDKWQRSAPKDLSITQQRDWILDRFNEHLASERQAHEAAIAARRQDASTPADAPEGSP